MNRIIVLGCFLFLLLSCNTTSDKPKENNLVSALRRNLHKSAGKGVLFGHQDDLAYGIGWKGVKDQSDVKRSANDYPALFGWEIGNIGDSVNIDGVPFDSIIVYIKRVYQMGGVNTISWHARNPLTNFDAWNKSGVDIAAILPKGEQQQLLIDKLDLVADFLSRLRTDDGELIPVIFRPWHEMMGNWFWWGRETFSNDQFIKLFQFTINYLKIEKGLDNLLIAFSPNAEFLTKQEYLCRYPGDEFVDVFGLDDYGDFSNNRLDLVVQKISLVVDLSIERNKLAAFTETGSDKLAINNWYTTNLLQVLKANEQTRSLAYVMVWRNRDTTHFYVPYPGNNQVDDFKNFVNDPVILLLEDYKQIRDSER